MVGINSQGPNFNQPNLGKKQSSETQPTADKPEAAVPAQTEQPSITASAVDILAYANQTLINRPQQVLSQSTQQAMVMFDQVHQMILSEFQNIAGIEDKAPAMAFAVLERHYEGQ